MFSLTNDLAPERLRYFFYLVTPSETSFASVDVVPDYVQAVSWWFLVLVLLEMVIVVCVQKKQGAFALNDSLTSMTAGMLSNLPRIGGKTLSLAVYICIYNKFHLVDVPHDSVIIWVVGFLAQDLAYYLAHRAVHEAGVLWAFHQMHHSSEYYNLTTALRQGCVQSIGTTFFECLQAIVTPPPIFMVHNQLNTIYQFWIHTETVSHLGPLEWLLNTPSHHRVHHGRNPYCIDRNYAGVLIIWDRIFGTFEAERQEEPPVYGLVTNVESFDPGWLQLFEFKALGWDKPRLVDAAGQPVFPRWQDKLAAVFGPPGYFPGCRTRRFFVWRCMEDHTEGIPEVAKPAQKYNPPLKLVETFYAVYQFVFIVFVYQTVTQKRAALPWSTFLALVVLLVSSIQVLGYYLDNRSLARKADVVRLLGAVVFALSTHDTKLIAMLAVALGFLLLPVGRRRVGKEAAEAE